MTDPARLYLAGCGMITPVGAHTARMQIGHDPRIEQGERRRGKYPG